MPSPWSIPHATPSVVHSTRYPLRGSKYAVRYPLRGRGTEGVGRKTGKYAVRPLAAFSGKPLRSPPPCCPFRGSTRVSEGRGSKTPQSRLRRDSSPTRGAKGALGMGSVVFCPPPYPPPMEGVCGLFSNGGGYARGQYEVQPSYRPVRGFYCLSKHGTSRSAK